MMKNKLSAAYTFPGFKPLQIISQHPYHDGAMVITLKRFKKKNLFMTARQDWFGIFLAAVFQFI